MMKRFLRHSPPFYAFLYVMFNTGRVRILETHTMDGADQTCANSGKILQAMRM